VIREESDNDISIGIKHKLSLLEAKLNDVSAGSISTSFLNKTTMLSEQRHMQEIYTKFKTNLPHNVLYLLMLPHVSTLAVGHLQGACKFFLACAAYVSTYMVGILYMIKIIIIMIIKYHNS